MNSCKASGTAGLTTAALCKNLSPDLIGLSWREIKNGRKQETQTKLLQLFCWKGVRGSLVVNVLETHCVSLLLGA